MRFEKYEKPQSINEALELLSFYRDDAKLLAGGTDLIPKLKNGALFVKAVIDLSGIEQLSATNVEENSIFLGSLLRLSEIEHNDKLEGHLSVLKECAGHVSSMQIRNVATIGGNSCNASPSADTVPGMIILDAVAEIIGKNGIRKLEMDSFFKGAGKTALKNDELLKGFIIPSAPSNTGAAYYKYAIRGHSDIALVGSGAAITKNKSGKIIKARIAIGSVGATALRIREAEKFLEGELPNNGLFDEAAKMCGELCQPITDQRATAAYRRKMTVLWTKYALHEANNRAS